MDIEIKRWPFKPRIAHMERVPGLPRWSYDEGMVLIKYYVDGGCRYCGRALIALVDLGRLGITKKAMEGIYEGRSPNKLHKIWKVADAEAKNEVQHQHYGIRAELDHFWGRIKRLYYSIKARFKCPYCGRRNRITARFCAYCDEMLD
jgi:hypothetical protein